MRDSQKSPPAAISEPDTITGRVPVRVSRPSARRPSRRPGGFAAITFCGGRIAAIDLITDPARLGRLEP